MTRLTRRSYSRRCADSFAGGEIKPDWEAVRAAFQSLGDQLGVSAVEAARGVVRIANANMTNALRLVSTNKGYDPREFALMAFGGGGPMHAAALAEELKVAKVIVPVNSAVFSAWGMLLTDLRRDDLQTRLMPLSMSTATAIVDHFRDMKAAAAANFAIDGVAAASNVMVCEFFLDMRYLGQEHTVKVPVTLGAAALDVEAVAAEFHAAHEKRYTYRLPNAIQIVNFHLVARIPVPKPELPRKLATGRRVEDAVTTRRQVDYDAKGIHDARIYDGDKLEPGMNLVGPAVIQEALVTLIVFPGQSVSIDDFGSYHVHLADQPGGLGS